MRATDCPSFVGYKFHAGKDISGYELESLSSESTPDLTAAFVQCYTDPACQAFTSTSLKYHVPVGALNITAAVESALCAGIYVKDGAGTSACPQLPGYTLYPNYYVPGHAVAQMENAQATEADLGHLFKSCGATRECKAFDTNGWLRWWVPLSPAGSGDGCKGTYIKNGAGEFNNCIFNGLGWSGFASQPAKAATDWMLTMCMPLLQVASALSLMVGSSKRAMLMTAGFTTIWLARWLA